MLRYVRKARRAAGSTGQVLLQLLEMRLDNTVFRMGMAPTIPAARQLVNHGHVTINGRVVNIPSYQCKPGEVVGVRDSDRSRKLVQENLQFPGLAHLPSHLEFDKNALTGKVNSVVEREWVALQVKELLVVEYYSRQA
jgi:small subunit ribosomal protein S4